MPVLPEVGSTRVVSPGVISLGLAWRPKAEQDQHDHEDV